MSCIEYDCIKVQQTPGSKPLYVTKIIAQDVLEWCSVPRSKASFMAGYQRELEGRYKSITDFFEDDPENNIIPNAILIAIDSDYVEIQESNNTAKMIIRIPDINDNEIIDILIDRFEQRLNDDELSSINFPDDIDTTEVEDEDEDEGDIGEDEAVIPPESYLAELTKKLRHYRDNPSDVDEEQVGAIMEFARSVTKPGLIIDGQHRIIGAKEINVFDVEFPAVFIPGLDHKEQVFHFYVINNKAKPLNRTHLRKIISTSLSKKEIDDLYDRLKQAGVEAKSAEWTYRMNSDDASPFKGLIDMGFQERKAPIDENIAYQVVNRFMKLDKSHKSLTKNVSKWDLNDNDFRLNCFYAIWGKVKTHYPNAWVQASVIGAKHEERQLFSKVALLNLQRYLLDSLDSVMIRRSAKSQPSLLLVPDDLKDEIMYSLTSLSEEFFTKPWKKKGLDTSSGHELFMNCLKKAISNKSKNLGNLAIFRP